MADFSKPVTTDQYVTLLQEIRDMQTSLALMFNGTTDTNIPNNTIRWNATNNRFEIYDSTASTWSALAGIGSGAAFPSVKDYYAQGDGIADDIVDLQNAVDDISTKGGGLLLAPRGTYNVSAPLIMKRGVYLFGEGVKGGSTDSPSTLISNITATAVMQAIITTDPASSGAVNDNIGISNLSFGGNNLATNILYLRDINNSIIESIYGVFSTDYGINWEGGSINTFKNINLTSNGKGLKVAGTTIPTYSTNSYFEDVMVYGGAGQADLVIGDNADNNLFIRCGFDGYTVGVTGGETTGCAFHGCWVGSSGLIINTPCFWSDSHSDYNYTVTGTAVDKSTFIHMRYAGWQWSKFGNANGLPIEFDASGNIIISNTNNLYGIDTAGNNKQLLNIDSANNINLASYAPNKVLLGYGATDDNPIDIWVNGANASVTQGITGALLAGSPKGFLLGATGYQKFDSGLILQWTTIHIITGGTGVTWTYPIAFPTARIFVLTTATGIFTDTQPYDETTTSAGIVAADSTYVRCLALGY